MMIDLLTATAITMREPLRVIVLGYDVLIGSDADCWKFKITDYGMWSPPFDTFREALQAGIKEAEDMAL